MQVSLFDRKRRFLLLIRRIRKLVQYNGAMTSTGASVLLVARCALMSYLYQYLLQYIVADVQYQYILVTAAICDHHYSHENIVDIVDIHQSLLYQYHPTSRRLLEIPINFPIDQTLSTSAVNTGWSRSQASHYKTILSNSSWMHWINILVLSMSPSASTSLSSEYSINFPYASSKRAYF